MITTTDPATLSVALDAQAKECAALAGEISLSEGLCDRIEAHCRKLQGRLQTAQTERDRLLHQLTRAWDGSEEPSGG